MPIKELKVDEWKNYFDEITNFTRGKLVKIEIDSPEMGAQIEAQQLTLKGLSYDDKDNVFILSTDEIEHMISLPRQIYITDGLEGLESLKISKDDGSEHIISFTVPLAFPASA
jgi:hypothetical protein